MNVKTATLALLALTSITACKPPAADDYVERVDLADLSNRASDPLPSPDVTGAVWAETATPGRILYGIPGQAPLLALTCDQSSEPAMLDVTRFAPADAEAKALFAFVGNGHIARVPVDATWNGRAWLWEGTIRADDPDLEVLMGRRAIIATLPGAGQLDLIASQRPRLLIARCRGEAPPEVEPLEAEQE